MPSFHSPSYLTRPSANAWTPRPCLSPRRTSPSYVAPSGHVYLPTPVATLSTKSPSYTMPSTHWYRPVPDIFPLENPPS